MTDVTGRIKDVIEMAQFHENAREFHEAAIENLKPEANALDLITHLTDLVTKHGVRSIVIGYALPDGSTGQLWRNLSNEHEAALLANLRSFIDVRQGPSQDTIPCPEYQPCSCGCEDSTDTPDRPVSYEDYFVMVDKDLH